MTALHCTASFFCYPTLTRIKNCSTGRVWRSLIIHVNRGVVRSYESDAWQVIFAMLSNTHSDSLISNIIWLGCRL